MNIIHKESKKLDVFLLILFPIIATPMILELQLNYFWSILLLFGLPAFWLSLRRQKMMIRAAIFSIAITIPFGIVTNYIGILDGSWYVPTTVFPFRLFGILPFEDVVGCFLLTYGVVIGYEHFLNEEKHNMINKKMKYFVWSLIFLLGMFFTLLVTHTEFPKVSYIYLWIGIIFSLLPIISTLFIFPRYLSKFWKVGTYFTVLLAMFEYIGVSLNHWKFLGKNFVGWVSYFGYKIPMEELFFFVLLFVVGIFTYYTLFDTDQVVK